MPRSNTEIRRSFSTFYGTIAAFLLPCLVKRAGTEPATMLILAAFAPRFAPVLWLYFSHSLWPRTRVGPVALALSGVQTAIGRATRLPPAITRSSTAHSQTSQILPATRLLAVTG